MIFAIIFFTFRNRKKFDQPLFNFLLFLIYKNIKVIQWLKNSFNNPTMLSSSATSSLSPYYLQQQPLRRSRSQLSMAPYSSSSSTSQPTIWSFPRFSNRRQSVGDSHRPQLKISRSTAALVSVSISIIRVF